MDIILYDTQLIGGLAGDALKSVGDSITTGIINGFKYITMAAALTIEKFAGVAIIGQEIVYFASKDNIDKGKIVKYILIFIGSVAVEAIINAI